jgi:hypothetical protein
MVQQPHSCSADYATPAEVRSTPGFTGRKSGNGFIGEIDTMMLSLEVWMCVCSSPHKNNVVEPSWTIFASGAGRETKKVI